MSKSPTSFVKTQKRFQNFGEFWPFYLSEHRNTLNRKLHFVGTLLGLAIVVFCIFSSSLKWIWAAPVSGYAFAWMGHMLIEKNRPATFQYPIYSFLGDFKMFFCILMGGFENTRADLVRQWDAQNQSSADVGTKTEPEAGGSQ